MATLAWGLHTDATSMVIPTCAGASRGHGAPRPVSSIALVLCLVLCCACQNERSVLLAAGSDDREVGRSAAPRSSAGGSVVVGAVSDRTPYPLDGLSRELGTPHLSCPEVELVEHAGREVAFTPSARVVQPFAARLLQFEQVVRAAAVQIYARPPSKILILASYGCRSVSDDNERLSEHALGNAIDVAGFVFDESADWPDTPAPLPGAFEVRVERHWQNKGDPALDRHARFLEALTRELLERGVFRTMLGPSHRDHADHFHFDMAPWDYVRL